MKCERDRRARQQATEDGERRRERIKQKDTETKNKTRHRQKEARNRMGQKGGATVGDSGRPNETARGAEAP